MIFRGVRDCLQELGLPEGDCQELPSSTKEFSDGGNFKIEIPTVNSIEAMEKVI